MLKGEKSCWLRRLQQCQLTLLTPIGQSRNSRHSHRTCHACRGCSIGATLRCASAESRCGSSSQVNAVLSCKCTASQLPAIGTDNLQSVKNRHKTWYRKSRSSLDRSAESCSPAQRLQGTWPGSHTCGNLPQLSVTNLPLTLHERKLQCNLVRTRSTYPLAH